MAAASWTTKAWKAVEKKYSKLEGKSEGVAFCAWAIDKGIEGLTDIRVFADESGASLKFSGASIGGAKVAMGKATKKARKAKLQAKGTKRRGRPAKRKDLAEDVGAVIAALLENLGAEIEEASVEYKSGRERLLTAKASFKKLRPVFEEYHAARSKKLAKLLDGIR